MVRDKQGNEIEFIRLSAEEFTRGIESKYLFENNEQMFKQKMRLIPSLDDILLNSNVNWSSPDHKNHKLFKEKGFENYRGRVRIDNVIFNTIVRVGKTKFGEVFYDINLEVDSYLPHTTSSASDIKMSTSINSIHNSSENINNEIVNNNIAPIKPPIAPIEHSVSPAGVQGDLAPTKSTDITGDEFRKADKGAYK